MRHDEMMDAAAPFASPVVAAGSEAAGGRVATTIRS
jgi:hypothetical protein